jgi:hypothetical protein
MKSFKGYLTEFTIQSTSDIVFEVGSQGQGSSALKIPISGPMFKRIWPDTIRATVFHSTSTDYLAGLKKLEGGKKSISAFFSMMAGQMESGIATHGGVVVEMEADILVSAKDDIMSQVDKRGRRWVEMSWFENAQGWGAPAGFNNVERGLDDLIRNLVLKHLEPILGNKARTEHEFVLWANMKRHLKDSKKLSLVIKDYFDGVEKIIKKNKEVMGSIFYGYARSKRMTDNAWDEQIVNNIKVKKLHVLQNIFDDDNKEALDDLSSAYPKPAMIKTWNSFMDIEIYTRAVVAKERGK